METREEEGMKTRAREAMEAEMRQRARRLIFGRESIAAVAAAAAAAEAEEAEGKVCSPFLVLAIESQKAVLIAALLFPAILSCLSTLITLSNPQRNVPRNIP